MALIIRSGSRLTGLSLHFLSAFFLLAVHSLSAQTALVCTTSSTNLVIRAEGLTEPAGSLLLNCNGGTAGQTVSANLSATFPTAITNRVNAAGTPDISLTVDIGTGPVTAGNAPILSLPNMVSLNGISFTVPASRALVLRLQNVRLAAVLLPAGQPIQASLSSTALSITSATATVATPMVGLLSNGTNTAITCTGSPLPSTINLPSLFSLGTRFTSLRVSEGFGNAFIPKDALSDTGTRILVNYSNFPAGARIFIPDYVAGNNASQPTAAGDLGGTQSAGAYAPTVSGTLLLARVVGAAASGSGGSPYGVASQFTGLTPLSSVSEVPLVNGAGIAVYEVIDANPFAQESAQFPTFLGLNATAGQAVTTANATLSFAPLSTTSTATSADPVPRFRLSTPPADCNLLGDCNSTYFPSLAVGFTPLTFRSPGPGLVQTGFITINNTSGGVLTYSAQVSYQNGNNFVFLDPTQGSGNSTIRVQVSAAGLAPGTYTASILISAGSAGSRTIPVTLTVDAPTVVPVVVSSITNAATFAVGPLVAGSLATAQGSNFGTASSAVSATFDGITAPVTFRNATQINLQVPAALAGKASAQFVVTVDGVASTAQTVQLAAAAPGVFGVLNQDGTVNSPANPAAPGSVVQVFATGLATTAQSFRATATVDTFENLNPLYAGDAPGIAGVQQVNVALPAGPFAAQPKLQVCSTNLVLRACSPSFGITIR